LKADLKALESEFESRAEEGVVGIAVFSSSSIATCPIVCAPIVSTSASPPTEVADFVLKPRCSRYYKKRKHRHNHNHSPEDNGDITERRGVLTRQKRASSETRFS